MKHTILVATTNLGKLKELTELLDDPELDASWKSLKEFPGISEVIEDGNTFAENARKKAIGYSKATGLMTIADDSGLVIDALNGNPGVYSARYASEDWSNSDTESLDVANYRKVLNQLKNVPDKKRTAHFVCHLCVASGEDILLETTGTVEGFINHSPVGDNGFGYDPIFYIPSLDRTAAQLKNDQKNQISHRGLAIKKLKPMLKNLFSA